ncbi:hypothetical protein V5O48_018865, partial [Marasmius crinis-equi]
MPLKSESSVSKEDGGPKTYQSLALPASGSTHFLSKALLVFCGINLRILAPTKDAQQGVMATSLMHEKRRADKARLKCGVLSDIEEEEEPVSRRSGARHASNRGNRDEQSPSPGPNETPLVASRTGGTAATLGRKRKQGETPPENAATLPASGVSRKKLKVDNGSNSEEEAVRSKAPEEITGRTKVGR